MYDCAPAGMAQISDVKLDLLWVKSIELGQEIKKGCFKI
jgi:hypothetical protein